MLVFKFAIVCNMKIDLWKQIDAVLDFEHSGAVLGFAFWIKFGLWEYRLIIFIELIEREIVEADTFFIISVTARPPVEIKDHRKYVTFQNGLDRDALFHQNWQVMEEQVARYKIVLVFNNVLNHLVDGLNLVGLHSLIYSCKVIESFTSLLPDLVFVDDWVLRREVLLVVVLEKVGDGPAVESQHGGYV